MHRHIELRHIFKIDGFNGVFPAVEPIGDGRERGRCDRRPRPYIVKVDRHHFGFRRVAVHDGIAGGGLPKKERAARGVVAAVIQLDFGAARKEIDQPRVIGVYGSCGEILR